ncbi:hypothetical protein BH11ACT8_BH11ACT8_35530 [soil metagenome]
MAAALTVGGVQAAKSAGTADQAPVSKSNTTAYSEK